MRVQNSTYNVAYVSFIIMAWSTMNKYIIQHRRSSWSWFDTTPVSSTISVLTSTSELKFFEKFSNYNWVFCQKIHKAVTVITDIWNIIILTQRLWHSTNWWPYSRVLKIFLEYWGSLTLIIFDFSLVIDLYIVTKCSNNSCCCILDKINVNAQSMILHIR